MRDIADRIWEFWLLDVLKPLVVLLAAAIHLTFLIAAWFVLAGVRDFGRFERWAREWRPVRPEIFEIPAERE